MKILLSICVSIGAALSLVGTVWAAEVAAALPRGVTLHDMTGPGLSPDAATGAVVWSDPAEKATRPVRKPDWLAILEKGKWAPFVVRYEPGTTREDGIAALQAVADTVGKAGYRRVVLAGQDQGALWAIEAARKQTELWAVVVQLPQSHEADADGINANTVLMFRENGELRRTGGKHTGGKREGAGGPELFPAAAAMAGRYGPTPMKGGRFARLYGECILELLSGDGKEGDACDPDNGLAAGVDLRLPINLQTRPSPDDTPAALNSWRGSWFGIAEDGTARFFLISDIRPGWAVVMSAAAVLPVRPDPVRFWVRSWFDVEGDDLTANFDGDLWLISRVGADRARMRFRGRNGREQVVELVRQWSRPTSR